MKIRKNLSDEDMLKGYEEEVSFENAVYGDEPVKNKKIKTAKNAGGKEILLPEEALEKLNRLNLPQPKRNPDGIKFNFTAGKFYIKEQC